MRKELFRKEEIENDLVTAKFVCMSDYCDYEMSRRCRRDDYEFRRRGIKCDICGHSTMLFAINEDPPF